MKKRKILVIVFLFLFVLISQGPVVYAGKAFYWLVTDGAIDVQSDFVEHSTMWTGSGLEERYAEFKWYFDKGTSRGGALPDPDKLVSGTQASLSATSSGNDLILTIVIIKGTEKNPSGGPETYKWTIVNGKDSANNCLSVLFTNENSGKTLPAITLYENDMASIKIPRVSTFSCRMCLI